MTGPDPTAAAPLLRVVRGTPSPEELAALVAVVASAAAAAEEAKPTADSQWAAPDRLHRRQVLPGGPGSWWSSGLPR